MAAGAGSGKTGALVACAKFLAARRSQGLADSGAQLAVITFTKAAAGEVERRIARNRLVAVSTIHSFAWRTIRDLTPDLRRWRCDQLVGDIATLREEEAKGRSGTNASNQRLRSISMKEAALSALPSISRFTYSPESQNQDFGSLGHADVLSAFSYLCRSQPLFRKILAATHPVILIDEVQDTRKDVLEAIIGVAQDDTSGLQVGLFGDPMQRIYLDGPAELLSLVPHDWERPILSLNFRSGSRIVDLLNKLREDHDSVVQYPRSDTRGAIRLFIEHSSDSDHQAERLAEDWLSAIAEPKLLILEHALAARRLGFHQLFSCFSDVAAHVRSELFSLDSTAGASLTFAQSVMRPLHQAAVSDDKATFSRILQSANQVVRFKSESIGDLRARAATLYSDLAAPGITAREATSAIAISRFFNIPQLLLDAIDPLPETSSDDMDSLNADASRAFAWDRALSQPLSELLQLALYTTGFSAIDTQQGTKGLEYETVLALLDDSASKGTTFKYEKLFGTVRLSMKDEENISNGVDSVVDRTRRLFYVACSRARERLAVVVRTADPLGTERAALENGWFGADEIVRLS